MLHALFCLCHVIGFWISWHSSTILLLRVILFALFTSGAQHNTLIDKWSHNNFHLDFCSNLIKMSISRVVLSVSTEMSTCVCMYWYSESLHLWLFCPGWFSKAFSSTVRLNWNDGGRTATVQSILVNVSSNYMNHQGQSISVQKMTAVFTWFLLRVIKRWCNLLWTFIFLFYCLALLHVIFRQLYVWLLCISSEQHPFCFI